MRKQFKKIINILAILLLFSTTIVMAESTPAPIDTNEISNIPLSSSYDSRTYGSMQGYYMQGNFANKNRLVFSKENDTFWWAIMVLVFGMILVLHYIGFAQVETTSDGYIPSTLILSHKIKSEKLLTPPPTRANAAFITFIITIILFKVINNHSNHEELIFDAEQGFFAHHKISKDGEISVIESIPFKNIVGIQKLKYDESGEQFYNFEINLVLNDYSRINLLATQQQEDIDFSSKKISDILGKKTIDSFYSDSED